MVIGNTAIVTPLDNPVQYDPYWRSALASALLDFPDSRIESEYLPYKKDEYVVKQMSYLRAVRNNRQLTKEQRIFRIASTWYQGNRPSDVKFKLEPLLLTPINFDIISLDIGGGEVDTEVFKAYERLYFSVRRENGHMHPSCQLRTYFSLPDGQLNQGTSDEVVWRVVAANQGYDALVSMWLWSDAHGLSEHGAEYLMQELWRATQARMFLDVYGRRVGHFDLTMLMGKITDHERMRRETGGQGTEGVETLKTLLHMLEMTQPHMLGAAKETDDSIELTAAIQAKFSAGRNISATQVEDKGKEAGGERLGEIMGEQFKKGKEST